MMTACRPLTCGIIACPAPSSRLIWRIFSVSSKRSRTGKSTSDMGPQRKFARLKPYLVSLLSVAVADGLTVSIESLFAGRAPLIFFILASVVSSAYGGVGPGLAATALGAILVILQFQTQVVLLKVTHASAILFVVLGIAISFVMGRLRTTNAKLAGTRDRLEAANNLLSQRTRDLAQANEELQRFAYALAHDLSTPLRGISALTDLLVQRNEGRFDESSKECAAMIVSRVRRTLSMIKGLLDYAAASEKPGERTYVDCNAAVAQALSDLDPAIQES